MEINIIYLLFICELTLEKIYEYNRINMMIFNKICIFKVLKKKKKILTKRKII